MRTVPEPLCDLSAGELGSASLASILIEALRTRATGEVSIDAAGGTSRLYLRDGHPRGVQIFFGFKPLGQFLLELGWIDIQGLERSLLAVADGRKQGEALVELGLLSAEQLSHGLGLLHRAHLRTLGDVTEGKYTFAGSGRLPAWTDQIRIPAHRAIVDALESRGGRAVARRILDDVPTGGAVRLRSGWESYAAHFELDEEELAFLNSMAATPRPLAELLASAGIGEARACAVVAALLHMGVVIVKAELTPGAPYGRSAGPIGSAPARAGAHSSGPGAGFSSPGPSAAAPRRADATSPGPVGHTAGGMAAASRSPSATSPGPVGHPAGGTAAASRSPSATSPGPVGHTAGGTAAALHAVGAASPGPGRHGAGGFSPGSGRSPGPAGGSAGKIPDRISDNDLERRIASLIGGRHGAVARGDHFAVLGLERQATPAEIKQAFLEAVKLVHPDRLPPSLSHLKRQARELFEAVTVANDVLSDLPKRRAWLAAWEKRHAGAEINNPDVRQLAAKGEQLLAQKRFGQALEFFKQALVMEDHPDLRAHAIWAANADPARPNLERARRELGRVLGLHPECAAAVAYLSRLDEGV